MTSLGAVLEGFPDEVITYITDPRTGIQRRSKWPPTISEVIEAAEEHEAHLARLRAPRFILKPRERSDLHVLSPGSLAKIFVPEGHQRYGVLVEWAKKVSNAFWRFGRSSDGRQGIWVSHEAWETRNPESVARSMGQGDEAT